MFLNTLGCQPLEVPRRKKAFLPAIRSESLERQVPVDHHSQEFQAVHQLDLHPERKAAGGELNSRPGIDKGSCFSFGVIQFHASTFCKIGHNFQDTQDTPVILEVADPVVIPWKAVRLEVDRHGDIVTVCHGSGDPEVLVLLQLRQLGRQVVQAVVQGHDEQRGGPDSSLTRSTVRTSSRRSDVTPLDSRHPF